MKCVLITLALLSSPVAAEPYVKQPPAKYQARMHNYIVQEVDDAAAECARFNVYADSPYSRVAACTIRREPPFLDLVIIEPACRFAAADPRAIYSAVACHEAAHTGPDAWPADHGGAQ